MDVGDPSNFVRILDLYNHDHSTITKLIYGYSCPDNIIRQTVKTCYEETGYLLDPHGASGYRALSETLRPGETGVFLETAHPAKFKDTIEDIVQTTIEIPQKLQEFMKGQKQSVALGKDYQGLKTFLLSILDK
jgi:threonine synthase